MIFSVHCSWALDIRASFNSSACLNSNPVQARLNVNVCQGSSDYTIQSVFSTVNGETAVEEKCESLQKSN